MTALAMLFSMGALARGQISQRAHTMNGINGSASSGTLKLRSAGGENVGVNISNDRKTVHRGGFIGSQIVFPDLDSDGDGLADELDSDNDNDSLEDLEELTGLRFTPTTATDPNRFDTDDDGLSDAREVLAGTNPQDPNAQLKILSIKTDGTDAELKWLARGGKSYFLRLGANVDDAQLSLPFNTNTVIGGTAPWFVVTNSITLPLSMVPNPSFFSVEIDP